VDGDLLGDTWTYDSVKNTRIRLRTAGSPVPREGASMFYDAVSPRLIMTGGQGEDPLVPILTDCWAFSY
jgi:hypothetical protein